MDIYMFFVNQQIIIWVQVVYFVRQKMQQNKF